MTWLLLLVLVDASATVTGQVLEAGRREPVRFALVEVVELGQSRVADVDGLFVLSEVPAGRQAIRVSAPGFVTAIDTVMVPATGRVHAEILLEPEPVQIKGLVAETSRVEVEAPEGRIIDAEAMKLFPTVVERDLVRAVQAQPSVTPSSDFSTALYVRGGTPDQTRVTLDGTPVYNVFHIGGFVSAFTPSATAAAVLRPGGLPASAPSSLSGMLEVHTRDGGRDSLRAAGSIGVLSSSLTVDGPYAGGRGTYLVSGRRTYVDAGVGLANALGLTEAKFPYGFTDLMGKFTLDAGRSSSVTLSGYLNREGLDDQEGIDAQPYEARWGSDAISLNYRGLVGSGLRVDATIGTSAFSGRLHELPLRDDAPGLQSSVRTMLASVKGRAQAGRHELSAGLLWETTSVDHIFESGALTEFLEFDVRGDYGAVGSFVRHRWRLREGLVADYGVRLERPRTRSLEVMPRARLDWAFTPAASMAISGGRYIQNWWSTRNEEGVPAAVVGYDLPVPVRSDEALPRGWDVVAELRYARPAWSLRADAYIKQMSNVPISPVNSDPRGASFVLHPDSLEVGRATIWGVEFVGSGQLFGTGLFVSYRYQDERRESARGRWIPRIARPHRLRLTALREWSERTLTASLSWESGLAYTPVVGREPLPYGVLPDGRLSETILSRAILGVPNSGRLPAYMRVDLELQDSWSVSLFGVRGTAEPYLSVLNVLGRRNALYVDYSEDRQGLIRELGPQLPVLPSFGLRWRF